jgi:hypothetical protein
MLHSCLGLVFQLQTPTPKLMREPAFYLTTVPTNRIAAGKSITKFTYQGLTGKAS